jgi:hypothetical protein
MGFRWSDNGLAKDWLSQEQSNAAWASCPWSEIRSTKFETRNKFE